MRIEDLEQAGRVVGESLGEPAEPPDVREKDRGRPHHRCGDRRVTLGLEAVVLVQPPELQQPGEVVGVSLSRMLGVLAGDHGATSSRLSELSIRFAVVSAVPGPFIKMAVTPALWSDSVAAWSRLLTVTTTTGRSGPQLPLKRIKSSSPESPGKTRSSTTARGLVVATSRSAVSASG